MEQPADCASLRALQCGRRMFLAALILASKYLQDRNYSAKAWSKMSGLKTSEINNNERNFLSAVSWKLHIPDRIFKKWTDIVLKYTAPQSALSPHQRCHALDNKSMWRQVVPLLNPELDDVRILGESASDELVSPAATAWSPPTTPTPSRPTFVSVLPSQETTPIAASVLPRFLEPKPDLGAPPTPALAHMGPLPTPQMTPSSVGSNTPAASVCSPRRSIICPAMALAQNPTLYRTVCDRMPCPRGFAPAYGPARSSSVAPSIVSFGSSPDSMISDSSRSSRSSSISSVSTLPTGAPGEAHLAKLATCRQAGLAKTSFVLAPKMTEGTAERPIAILDDVEMTVSPGFATFTFKDHEMHLENGSQQGSARSSSVCRKRGLSRSSSSSDLELQDNIRALLQADPSGDLNLQDDEKIASSQVTNCTLREAFSALSDAIVPYHVKGVQPACTLRRGSGNRLPVCTDTRRKRTCCTVRHESNSHEPDANSQPSEDHTELFMEITPCGA